MRILLDKFAKFLLSNRIDS